MSPIMTIGRHGFLLLIGLAMLAGCGTPNDNAPFPSDAQKHTADWLPADHMNAANANIESCKECHGSDLLGGISNSSCLQCHLGGVTAVHPLTWNQPIALNHSPYVDANGTAACANASCHGSSLGGVANSGPSCSSCHIGGPLAIHPADWAGQISTKHGEYAITNTAISCRNMYCHGQDLLGVPDVSPPCNVCHAMPEKVKRR